ncbi:hypothetical protein FXO38_19952 [Capsicum annuum]|nr:hypothetical protein FXO38_19952 [Capsicum annuum]KAF3669256.1 hypothetical protein FXO37_09130 [Capsicum annuum]
MIGEPKLAPPFLEFVSDGERHVEGESTMSFNKDIENDIGSVDRASKNSENAPPFDQPTAHTSCPPTVQPIAYSSSPSFVQPTAYASSPRTVQPTTHVSSPIDAAPCSSTTALTNSTAAPSISTVASTNSTAAPSESVVDSDVESIDGSVEIESDVNGYVDKELGGTRRKGPDTGYDESVGGDRNSLEGKLAGDEPFYPSDEATSFETDSDDGLEIVVTEYLPHAEHRMRARHVLAN